MTIGEIIRQGLHYARTCNSLWLFGFFVGIWSGGSGGAGGGRGGASNGAGGGVVGIPGPLGPYITWIIALLVGAILLAIVAGVVMRFVSEGALIEGVVRARQGARQHRRIDARVLTWLEARDTPLMAEWLGLFKVTPFAALGLVTVSAVPVVATPLLWFARVLM